MPTVSLESSPSVRAPDATSVHLSGIDRGVARLALDDIDLLFPGGAPPDFSLTPDAVIQMIRTRLRDLDLQIGGTMDELDHGSVQAREISADLEALRRFERAASGHLDGEGRVHLDHIVEGPDGAPISLTDWALQVGFGAGDQVSRQTIQSHIDGLNDEIRQVNSGNELRMVRLQSAMQQRTSIIQMGTNLLKSIDESTDAIVSNLR